MKILILFVALFIANFANAQETNNNKKMWARSVLNESAPKLTVEKWISKKPETKGKFILIDFWATWCGPCRKYIPLLNQLHEKYANQLTIIGLSDEDEKTVASFNTPKINYFEAIDTEGTMIGKLEVKGIPHVIFIDPKGIVRWEGYPLLGNAKLTEKVIIDLMEKYKN